MERERWAQVKQILGTYLDLEADERAGYLAQCCEGNAELLADVQRLINSHDGLGDFLETPLFGGEPEELLTGAIRSRHLIRGRWLRSRAAGPAPRGQSQPRSGEGHFGKGVESRRGVARRSV
jgi:hypothetical protein